LDFANHPYLCKGLYVAEFLLGMIGSKRDLKQGILGGVKSGFMMIVPIYAKVSHKYLIPR
jgi:hypothetical protein